MAYRKSYGEHDGSAGIVGGGGNLYPGLLARLNTVFSDGDLAAAQQLQQDIVDAWRKMSAGKAVRTWVKQVWQQQGIIETAFSRFDAGKALADYDTLNELTALIDLGENYETEF